MKYILFSVFLGIVFLNATTLDKDKFNTGKKIYNETCISCHGKDGKSKTQMQLLVKPRDLSKTILDENQTYLITKFGARYWGAKADIMPSFKSVYNEYQLRSVAYFISHKFNANLQQRVEKLLKNCEPIPKNKDKKMKKWGKKIYKRNCSWCHGKNGHGNGLATKSPIDSIFPYDLTKTLLTNKQVFLYTKFGGHYFGTYKKDMPGWHKKYNDFRLHSVVKYVNEVIKGE